jgi:RNA polymerase primary sigma factor
MPMNADYDESTDTLLAEARSEPILGREDEVELFKRYEAGDPDAREKIVKANLRFVVKIAHEFSSRGLSLSDLIQEGTVGLLEVIPRFDWRKGHRFSTYAAYWIRQSIQMALRRQCGMIRLPVRKSRAVGRMNEQIRQFHLERGRDPMPEELADLMDMTLEEVKRLLNLREGVLSLDAQRDEDGACLLDTIPSHQTECPREAAAENQMRSKVARVFEYLSEREQKVLRLRFGFDNGRMLSLRRTSKIVGLSQEGVRRIEQRALDRLRRPSVRCMVAELV